MNKVVWTKQFVAYFWFVGWDCISIGMHVCLRLPNFEIHLPFGFIRIGWVAVPVNFKIINKGENGFGLMERDA